MAQVWLHRLASTLDTSLGPGASACCAASAFLAHGAGLSWTIWYDQEQWWGGPTVRHSMGTNWSMADGYVEYWKWQDMRTMKLSDRLLGKLGQPLRCGNHHQLVCLMFHELADLISVD